jgi:hypothetical protein
MRSDYSVTLVNWAVYKNKLASLCHASSYIKMICYMHQTYCTIVQNKYYMSNNFNNGNLTIFQKYGRDVLLCSYIYIMLK